MRPERAIMRHWRLVMLAHTFSLLVGAPPLSQEEMAAGKKSEPASDATSVEPGASAAAASRAVWNQALRRVRAWLYAPGLGCSSTGDAGRAPPHRPN